MSSHAKISFSSRNTLHGEIKMKNIYLQVTLKYRAKRYGNTVPKRSHTTTTLDLMIISILRMPFHTNMLCKRLTVYDRLDQK